MSVLFECRKIKATGSGPGRDFRSSFKKSETLGEFRYDVLKGFQLILESQLVLLGLPLAGWPVEFPTAQYVVMQMRHGLAAVRTNVRDDAITRFINLQLLCDLGYDPLQMTQ